MRRPPLGARVLPVALLALAAGACSGGGSSDDRPDLPEEVVVDHTEATAEVAVGQTLVVDFGEISSSIGDGWAVAVEPDPAVLGPGEEDSETVGEEVPGARSELWYSFDAVAEGTTSITFQYSYRGDTEVEYRGGPSTLEMDVTVTER